MEDKQYPSFFQKCPTCGEMFDPRDLGQVGFHFHDDDMPKFDKTDARKVGDSVQYNKDGSETGLN